LPETWLKRKEAMKAKGYNGNGCGTPLTIAVQLHGRAAPASSSSPGSRQGLWPTPEGMAGGKTSRGGNRKDELLLSGMVKQWATPNAGDGKAGMAQGRLQKSLGQDVSNTIGGYRSEARLNPRWVETLMGLPIGWTMPSCTSPQTIAPMSCDSSVMELSQPQQSELSEFFLAS
jgi:hypothetical protein